ncbi:nucleoside triphosphate pyrophosphohydrolase family protein [Paenisporosarcina antarctica]|uniref:MazG-like protein n=1 Tax=Paenisporosarcina antarctica TaxID=417367 RepID=A0A4P6ZXW6_9BACL|nr:MazG-like protein [Paenisporosarcina antarctica]QBP41272.1 MazG-like protein [Paenisporosarcina antarctica]
MNFNETVDRSLQIRKIYHQLENKHHGTEWSVEEDALAFLTDAALVGRLTMAHQERWPTATAIDPKPELMHKIGESIWWLIILAERMDINSEQALEQFLEKKEKQFM